MVENSNIVRKPNSTKQFDNREPFDNWTLFNHSNIQWGLKIWKLNSKHHSNAECLNVQTFKRSGLAEPDYGSENLISEQTTRKMSIYKMVYPKVRFWNIFDHSKSGQVQISDPPLYTILRVNNKNASLLYGSCQFRVVKTGSNQLWKWIKLTWLLLTVSTTKTLDFLVAGTNSPKIILWPTCKIMMICISAQSSLNVGAWPST